MEARGPDQDPLRLFPILFPAMKLDEWMSERWVVGFSLFENAHCLHGHENF